MSFRKEKKFRLSYSDMTEIKRGLLLTGMTALHPLRVISSCYFDTKNLVHYHQSEEGIHPRKKIRIRWYKENMLFTKEVKISSVEGRYKYTSLMGLVNSIDDLKNLNIFDSEYGKLNPVLIVKYEREYYFLKGLRITFDKNITYSDLRFNTSPTYKESECVMEVKVSADCSDDYIERIIPHSTSRFSKYSRGLLYADGMI